MYTIYEEHIEQLEEEKKTTNVTNNALFVGSTAELQKLLKSGLPKESK